MKSRAPSLVSFWPAQVRRQRRLPIVFCHVEGQEESAAIATSESNEESKRNMKEVHKAVSKFSPDLRKLGRLRKVVYQTFFQTKEHELIIGSSCPLGFYV